VNGGGAPKPSPALWAELEAAGAEAARQGVPYETHPRWLIARARYKTWLHEQDIEGHPDPLHGHAPTDPDRDWDGGLI
jgi:hypothetical protein